MSDKSTGKLGSSVAKIRFRGLYDWEGLFRLIRGWFEAREYDFFENRYKHKAKPPGSELEINFTAYREINDYARNVIKMYFHIWDAEEVEVVRDGKKKKMWNARMLIDFTAYVELDYDSHWEHSPFLRILRNFYHKYIIKHEIDDVWTDKLWYKVNELQQECKRFLGMQSESDVYDDMW